MDKGYCKFLRAGIDLAPLGVEQSGGEACFCTPRGASFIGWEGVDGIHYCFVRGYGSVVFAVSPENTAPDYVHAAARDFTDFLRLLLACGHGAAIEQCWNWDRGQFDAYLAGNPPTESALAVMREIREKLALEPMDDPWGYIHELQAGFDYKRIKYTGPDAIACDADTEPETWEVRFAGLDGSIGSERRLDMDFVWCGHEWRALAVYSCDEGLVLDVAMTADTESVRNYVRRWYAGEFGPGKAGHMRAERANPLEVNVSCAAEANGRALKYRGMSCFTWVPLDGWEQSGARLWLEHYGLDAERSWQFCRMRLSRKHPADVRSLTVTLTQQPVDIPGECFTVSGEGDVVRLTNPVSGAEHTLTVTEYAAQVLSSPRADNGWDYPDRFVAMEYTLTPDTDTVSIVDAADGDSARSNSGKGETMSTAVFALVRSDTKGRRSAASSVYFAPPERIEWMPVYRGEAAVPIKLTLI